MKNLDAVLHPGDLTTVTSVVLALNAQRQSNTAAVHLAQPLQQHSERCFSTAEDYLNSQSPCLRAIPSSKAGVKTMTKTVKQLKGYIIHYQNIYPKANFRGKALLRCHLNKLKRQIKQRQRNKRSLSN